jgi:hypothetical protein
MAAMTDPETVDRAAHPRLDITEPYADDTNDRIIAAVKASPTTAVRVYYPHDDDESADVLTLDNHGDLIVIDPGDR